VRRDKESSWEAVILKTEKGWGDNIKMKLRDIDCEDGRWVELSQDRDQWRALMLVLLILRVLLAQSWLIS